MALHGLDASLKRRYARLQNRYAVSQEVAALARRRLKERQGAWQFIGSLLAELTTINSYSIVVSIGEFL